MIKLGNRKIDEEKTAKWRRIIGELNPGFMLVAFDGYLLHLYFCGQGFREIIQPGGKKPSPDQEYAYICSISTTINSSEEVIVFIKKNERRTMDKLNKVPV